MTDQQTAQAETATVEAMMAVVGDNPADARRTIAAMNFRGLALLVAWADELKRLGLEAQTDYETRERAKWRGYGL